MIDRNTVIASILWYKMSNQTATVAQIAEMANWTEEETEEELEKICQGRTFPTDSRIVVRNNTSPVTYFLEKDTSIATPEHELDEYIRKRTEVLMLPDTDEKQPNWLLRFVGAR